GKYTDLYEKWCKQCRINDFKKNFVNWTSGNEKIDEFIQKMQLKIIGPSDIIFEWIPYDQFNDIKEITKKDLDKINSAIWKDGPLNYNINKYKYERDQNKEVTLKLVHNSQSIDEV